MTGKTTDRTPTLRQRVSQISVGTFLAAATLMLAGFVLYSSTKNNIAIREVERELGRSSSQQIEQLVPSFLLPEQRSGVSLLVEKYRRDEALSGIQIITDEKQKPLRFLDCTLDTAKSSSCQSADGKETAVVTPISEGDSHFGWLLKSRLNASAIATRDLLQMAGIFIFVLALTFIVVYGLIARMLSRTMPKALDDLVTWIESDLAERSSNIKILPYKELEDLKEKISEVLERHNRNRDQAVIGQLTSGIMHDIKTPLQSMVTAMHLADRYTSDHPKRQARLENLLEMCKANLPIIGRIIETTLDGSRQIQITKERKDLVTTVRDAVQFHKDLLDLRNADLNIDSPDELSVPHDTIQVTRVISNLIKNGLEATATTSGKPRLSISLKQNDESVVILIDDNGPGVSTTSEKLFRAFRSSKVHGSGLGLHISRKIIAAHHGSIVASNTSSLGGARFEIQLPLNDSGEATL
ncbi:MAG: HAMP domain-containing sensor histidine kinase [Bdellovibrionia bacterium]